MTDINRPALYGKLNPFLFRSLESATSLCKLRGNPYVELVHWLHQMLAESDSDLHRLIVRFDLNAGRLDHDLSVAMDRLPRGASAIADFSAFIDEAIERAWVYSTIAYGRARIRSAFLLAGILKTPSLRNQLLATSQQWGKLVPDLVMNEIPAVIAGSAEDNDSADTPEAEAAPDSADAESALQRFAVDMTAQARADRIDPITGRESEIRQVIDVLMRRRQNNPLLTGEAGVGKTAIAEGLALRIAAGDVPPALRDVTLYSLDMGLLQAGASVKGEFEARLQQIISEVERSTRPVVLFIDEVHRLIGAGGAHGTGDAANLLKPALARGQLRTIGATTWSEYKKYIESDPALTRRFEAIQVREPSEDEAVAMLRGLVGRLERHHRIVILDQAVDAAVRLSNRYLPARQLPDKAISLMDTACARVVVGRHAPPPAVEDLQRRISALEAEQAALERERLIGLPVEIRPALGEALAERQQELAASEARWKQQREQVEAIVALRAEPHEAQEAGDRRATLARLRTELAALQGDTPLVQVDVDVETVAAVLADWTGIPAGRMLRNEAQSVLALPQTLARRVIGQPAAMDAIARRVQNARAALDDPQRPVGVFLLCGPSGVGKTETALALAEVMYGGEQNLISINMNEFQESHTVSTLKGAPPGYVGYGEGGILTEAVRRRPYSVVLLDEMEKAHPDVQEAFYQIFDKGWMEDGEGRRIDFRNTILILTTNAGDAEIMRLAQEEPAPASSQVERRIRDALREYFTAAFLGRLTVVPFYPLSGAVYEEIIAMRLRTIGRRLAEQHEIAFHHTPEVGLLIHERCAEVESGGRLIDSIITQSLLPLISREIISALAENRTLNEVRISVENNEFQVTLC
ncbi:type VI secretion system ATPase TssH [Caballeronia sp. LZ034LL]|uniref:type VI secretion system ATPase TssH n=1 Tax=Caballeronia sp. LZ034LL TaxID=3038567 RepID=UPI0028620D06|nr:type VI secretion system ATPase TssH [Caballeronia sp. LZ034LL]MDR5836398.1 type VI secretion system ATPase TssH [Caballeronia sp. LZ034LL]